MGEERGVYRILVGKSEGRRPPGRPRRRREDNINRTFKKWDERGTDLIELAQDRDMWRALDKCCNELSGSIKCREFLD
jgi:hypothetical protein